jgi:CBS domain-containing protein
MVTQGSPIVSALEQFPVSLVLDYKNQEGKRAIVSVHESTPLSDVLSVMAKENILSVPIFKATTDLSGKIFTGIVSVHDILSFGYFQEIFDRETLVSKNDLQNAMNNFKKTVFFSTPVKQVLERREEPIPAIMSSTDTISTLIKLFTRGKHHRVLVVRSDILIDSPVGPLPADSSLHIVSQMDLVKFLYATCQDRTRIPSELVKNLFSLPLAEIKTPTQNAGHVIALMEYQPALAGFNIMHLNNVHAVPVVRDDQVVGTLSSAALRGLNVDNVDRLLVDVSEFLQLGQQPLLVLDTTDRNHTVESAVALMLQDRIHHVWITNAEKVLSGCLTLTDILYLFTPTA